ncbi:adenylosuccinate synthase [Oscillospiraceae bacterium HV4-5-C5C]|nr:adenylosuccinate synthase [Oscillospiraceae bacterium HV4-5-C5C]
MSTRAIVGINWGDEGKGRMVDLIAGDYDYVVRYQGGNNAGHTVVNPYGKFVLNLFPSGIFNPGVTNVLGNGMVIDIEHLVHEHQKLEEAGFKVDDSRLLISDRAIICFPFHRLLDELQEDSLGGRKFGSTRRGIAFVYGDKYMKKGIQMGELLLGEAHLRSRIIPLVEEKNLLIEKVYGGQPVDAEEMVQWALNYGGKLKPFIKDTGLILAQAIANGKSVLFEAQLGALRDVEFGIYPYTSSSLPIAAYAPIGAGIPGAKLDSVLGIIKAYSSCVGEGPFTCEMFGEAADQLRQSGAEYGAATGRPRRVGGFDVVASRYGVRVQAATELALTKLDILSPMKQIPVCTAYKYKGELLHDFPFPGILDDCEPVVEYWDGWNCDISGVRTFADLPQAARDYVLKIEQLMSCPVTYISVGAERDAIIRRG